MSEKRCGDCKYFVAFRNYNYETCTNDTITEYCELLQNEDTYDRDKGDEIWNDVFDDCPLKTGYVSTESAILLVKSKKEVSKQFDNYVRISCEEEKKLQDENEQLKAKASSWKITASKEGVEKTELMKQIVSLKEENEQLKKEHKIAIDEMITDYKNLEKENKQLMEQIQILKKEVRDFLHLCDVCDIQSHLSDECEEVLNDD